MIKQTLTPAFAIFLALLSFWLQAVREPLI